MHQFTPVISIVIPTFNRFQMLERALKSVLAQNFKSFNIILIDDASTDKTYEQLYSKFRLELENGLIKYIRNEKNIGRSACRNIGINLSNGQFIAFLDDDDEWLSDHLFNLYNFLEIQRDIGIVFSNWYTVDERTQEIKLGLKSIKSGAGKDYLNLMISALIGYPSTSIVRTNLIKQIGGFNEELKLREDWELFTKCAIKSKIGFTDKPTVRIYVHPGSYSKNKVQWVNSTELAWFNILNFANQYSIKIDKKFISERSLRLSRGFISIGEFNKAKKYLLNAILYKPISIFSIIGMENIFKLAIGKKFYLWYKKN